VGGRCEIWGKVIPVRMHAFNQSNFLSSSPSFQLLLASDSQRDLGELFEIHQTGNTIPRREGGRIVHRAVIGKTIVEIAGDSDVQDATKT